MYNKTTEKIYRRKSILLRIKVKTIHYYSEKSPAPRPCTENVMLRL